MNISKTLLGSAAAIAAMSAISPSATHAAPQAQTFCQTNGAWSPCPSMSTSVSVSNTNANVPDNSTGVAVSTGFGSPVVGHNFGYDGTYWDPFIVDGGRSITYPYAARAQQLRCVITISGSTATSTCTGMPAQGSGIKIGITDIGCTTPSTSAAPQSVQFNLFDSSTTNQMTIDIPQGGGGGGFLRSLETPFYTAANTSLQITDLTTAAATLHCHAAGFASS